MSDLAFSPVSAFFVALNVLLIAAIVFVITIWIKKLANRRSSRKK